ncbi:ExeM/NucH family extracellular endonuclease [Piscinibacter sp.]|uniref:ExeM/NucH family extracellular endonuclease n=1 Tax=Piscinibacter sp. TaxID=1903157 RepID=UPI002D07FC3F|nr:ExeM/NucH family extracellular endonuclease [Albitalea sp.]HUG25813.1 ExeM/NucH family extracellular endonuclease [Albitalea sp.]
MTTSRLLWRGLAATVLAGFTTLSLASASGVVISQVYGGGGNSGAPLGNDYVELFNAGSAAVDVTGWSVQYASATGSGTFAANSPALLPPLALQPGQSLLVGLASGGSAGAPLPPADATGTINMSASAGKVVLVNAGTGLDCNGGSVPCSPAQLAQIVDLVGYGSANFFETAPAPGAANTTALLRAATGCTDGDNNAADFATGAPAPRNSASPLAPCAGVPGEQPIVPTCPGVAVPAGVGGSVTLNATDADSIVTSGAFGGPVPAGFALGPFTPAPGDGGTATVELLIGASVPAGSYSVPVNFANNEMQTASCNVDVTVSSVVATAIYNIQGSGSTSPLVGQTVTTSGVVTKLTNNGYFLQDMNGDGNPATSDGIFVFTSNPPSATVGQLLQVTAKVAEFNPGAASNPVTAANPVTELTDVSAQTLLGSGLAIAPTAISLPETVSGELERVEGMLVRIDTLLTVSQNYFLGRYGQATLSAGGRMETPTNRHRPGTPEAAALADANLRSSIVLDDGTSLQNPSPIPYIGQDATLRAGDTVQSLTGVIDYGLATDSSAGPADYRIHPTVAPAITRAHPRSAAPSDVGGNLRVASFNVLNYFTTLDDGTAGCFPSHTRSDCRGADNASEFTRQRTKIIAALAAIDADAVGLMEIENNGNTAVQNLVDSLNATLGAGTYAALPLPAGGTGGDAIRVGMIYKPVRLSLAGGALSDTNPVHDRPPLAQTFAAPNGERFTLVVNHFKSKGCSGATGADLDQGDGQGCFNARRSQQAEALRSFIATLQAGAGDTDVLVIGDLNAYAKEDPVVVFTNAGYVDAIGRFDGFGYSYVFDGAAGRLDHALATASLSPQVTGVTAWHVNADEPSVIDYNLEFKAQDLYTPTPFRSSDHDPVLIGLSLVKTLTGTPGRDIIVGTPGDDVITGGAGIDVLSGGGGRNVFVYTSMRDAVDAITDFKPAIDRLDLFALLASIGRDPGRAVDDGVVRVVDTAHGARVQIDADGSAGRFPALPLVTLRGVSASQIDMRRDFGL